MRFFETKSFQDTISLAEKIGLNCKGGEVLALYGELGAGKTQFAKGVAKGLGIQEKDVQSPTFVISQLHTNGRLPFIHIDLYRLDKVTELEDLGWYDFLQMEGVIVIEWAEKIQMLLSEEEVIFVNISSNDIEERNILIKHDLKFNYLFNWP